MSIRERKIYYMEKALEIEEGREIIKKFIDLHKNNLSYDYKLKLNFLRDRHEDEEYFAVFKSILINHFETSHEKEKLSEIPLFISYKCLEKDRWGFGNVETRRIDLPEYLKLIKSSKFPFDYLAKLEEFKEKNNYLDLFFEEEELIKFCSKHVYYDLKHNTYYIDIKKIEPKKYQYACEGEKKTFNKIDKLWKERDYRGVIDECDTLLGHFVKNLYEVKTRKEFSFTDKKKDQEIETILKEITSSCKLPKLKSSLSKIIKEFNNMRNKLGKNKAPYKSEKWWKKFNELPEIKKVLYTRIIMDLLKSLHNSLLIIQRDWEKFLDK